MAPCDAARDSDDALPLSDRLAVDRTTLANERTFLAYVRTALGFFAVGVTFLHFLEPGVYYLVGYAFIALGPLAFGAGAYRFKRVSRRLAAYRPRDETA